MRHRIIIDTNVFIAALRSRRGASHHLFLLIGSGKFETFISTALILEYQDVALRMLDETALQPNDLEAILDYICAVSQTKDIFYLWRPYLPDPNDDMLLELAVASQSDAIITFNRRHFYGAERFGLKVLTPKQFLKQIGEIK